MPIRNKFGLERDGIARAIGHSCSLEEKVKNKIYHYNQACLSTSLVVKSMILDCQHPSPNLTSAAASGEVGSFHEANKILEISIF